MVGTAPVGLFGIITREGPEGWGPPGLNPEFIQFCPVNIDIITPGQGLLCCGYWTCWGRS